jgi:peptide/nickel transport system permease protein
VTGSRLRYAGRRLAQAVPVVLAMVIFNFALLHLAPGDAADVLAGEAGSATPEFMAQLRADFGLDRPLLVQLGYYLRQVLALDLGFSFRHKLPVLDLIVTRLPATLVLMGTAITLAVTLGMVLGVIAARYVNTWVDGVVSVFALLSYATPIFWIGLMLIVLFGIHLGWLPTHGMALAGTGVTGPAYALDVGRHLILPAATLALFYVALYTRLMRAAMLEVYTLDYVQSARAKGLGEGRIAVKHVLRNALLPVVTMAGVQVGHVLGGSVLVETVFGWPGLGRLAFESVFARDVNLLLGLLLFSSLLVVLANLATDLLYSVLDPRIAVR